MFDVDTRQAAIDRLLAALGEKPESAWVDPSRTMIRIGAERLWTLLSVRTPAAPSTSEAPSLRRGGAKHRHVR